jgi:FAD/FMN-containing dehydrogenase
LPENGFNVARALVGTESTCVTVVEATVRLVPSPPHRVLLMLGFSDLATAGDHVPLCDLHKPIALEGMAESMFHYMELKGASDTGRSMFPAGKGWLICEFGGDTKKRRRNVRAAS